MMEVVTGDTWGSAHGGWMAAVLGLPFDFLGRFFPPSAGIFCSIA
jgi:hypothetical protein